MTGVEVPRRGPLVRAEDGLWASLPGRIWPRTPGLGLMLADGGWLRARPGLALVAPAFAFALGAFRGGWRPEDELTYGYSLLWLLVLLAVALAGCALAWWLWLGFVVGDLFVFDHPPIRLFARVLGEPSLWDQFRQFLLPHLVSYLLLAALMVSAPLIALVARGAVSGLLATVSSSTRTGFAAAAAAVAAGAHAGLWTQAYPLLIRPLWTWHDRLHSPDAAAIAPVQDNPVIVGVVAGAAAAAWTFVSAAGLRQIVGRRYQPVARTRAPGSVHPVSSVGWALLKAGLVTLLLGGIIPAWWHGVVTATVLFIAFVAQSLLLPRTAAARWWTARLPAVLRLPAAAAVAWLVAWQIGRTAYDARFGRVTGQDFDPLLWAAVAAIACMALLLPAVRADTDAAGETPSGPAPPAGNAGQQR
jgi:hypothetical protein